MCHFSLSLSLFSVFLVGFSFNWWSELEQWGASIDLQKILICFCFFGFACLKRELHLFKENGKEVWIQLIHASPQPMLLKHVLVTNLLVITYLSLPIFCFFGSERIILNPRQAFEFWQPRHVTVKHGVVSGDSHWHCRRMVGIFLFWYFR